MHEALRKKPFVDLILTEEASLMDVTLYSGGGQGGGGGGGDDHGHGHGHGHDNSPKQHGHGGDF